jgi:hypothetical protein
LSYKVVKYRQQSPGVIESSEIAWFDDSTLADNLSSDLNAQEPPGGPVWYEAHPVGYSQVPMHSPTPPPFAPTLATLKEADSRLKRRAELYDQYMNPALAILGISVVLALIFVTAGPTLIANRNVDAYYGLAIATLVFLIASIPLLRRARKQDLKVEEWMFLRAFRVLDNLNDYLQNTDRPPFKERAEKALRGLASRIEEVWKVGDYKLADKILAPLVQLKTGLRETLLPSIERGEMLELCRTIMAELCSYLLNDNPRLEDVRRLDSMITSLGGAPRDRTWYSKMWRWLMSYLRARTFIPTVLSLVSGPILFVVLTSYGFAKEVVLGPSVELTVGLTGTWVAWLSIKGYINRKTS